MRTEPPAHTAAQHHACHDQELGHAGDYITKAREQQQKAVDGGSEIADNIRLNTTGDIE